MRIVCISDTHLLQPPIPAGDLLIHAGDLCLQGTMKELELAVSWLDQLPHLHKVVVAGNHDRVLDASQEGYDQYMIARLTLERADNVHYLFDSGVEVGGYSIYGSPWTQPFSSWAFNLDDDAREVVWSAVPAGTDILVSHGPPLGVLDKTSTGLHVGCPFLLRAVDRVRPKLHVFGHVHESYGKQKIGDVQFVNASICSGPWRIAPENPPVVIDI